MKEKKLIEGFDPTTFVMRYIAFATKLINYLTFQNFWKYIIVFLKVENILFFIETKIKYFLNIKLNEKKLAILKWDYKSIPTVILSILLVKKEGIRKINILLL